MYVEQKDLIVKLHIKWRLPDLTCKHRDCTRVNYMVRDTRLMAQLRNTRNCIFTANSPFKIP